MVIELQPPLTARNGHTRRVLSVRRVSSPGPGKQDIRSLDDQGALHDRWLANHTDQPYEITVIAGSGSGEFLERAEFLQLIDLVESDQFDLVLTEDLGRIVRRIQAHLFCELCVDHQTRLIAINDHVDTAVEGWQDRSIFSAWHHERTNRDTSDRIKRSHRNRFLQGGTASLRIFGYHKPPDAKSDAEWQKIPAAEPIYRKWFDMLDHNALYAEVADWLNQQGIQPGPYARQCRWNGPMVGRVTHNTLLKGERFRNKRKTRRISAGKYKSEKAQAADLLTRRVPHLAFFDEAYYDRVIAKADARNAKYRRNGNGDPDPCQNRPKKRTRFPGQTCYCGICGRLFVFGGHGQTDHLMCEGARKHKCWNGITFEGTLAAQRFADAALAEIEKLEAFDSVFLDKVNHQARSADAARHGRLEAIDRELHAVQRQINNVIDFIRGGDSERVRAELRRLEDVEKGLLRQKDEEAAPSAAIVIPSAEEVKAVTRTAFQDLALDSYEFAKRMRELTGKIYVYPFRLCEDTPYVLRAKLQLRLAGLLPDKRAREVLQSVLTRDVRIDLFEMPQRVGYREQVVAGRHQRDANGRQWTEREVARSLGITVAAAQRAAALDRLMQRQGLTDPYVLQLDPPTDHPKLRRHLHPRYHFEPLPEHVPDW